jgi:hypothetical protein
MFFDVDEAVVPVLKVNDLTLFRLELSAGYSERIEIELGTLGVVPFLAGLVVHREKEGQGADGF